MLSFESSIKAFLKTKKLKEILLQQIMKNRELPKQNGTVIATSMREKQIRKKTFQLTRTCSKSTKLIIFQFKVVHRRLPETETLLHFSCQCKVTSLFWGNFFQWLQSCSLFQKGNYLAMATALGLKPDSSNTKLQV